MSIKANDLRLGNYISVCGNTIDTYQTYKPIKVNIEILKAIYEENLERPDAILSTFKPIPLSHEILEKCEGFYQLPNFNIQNEWIYDLDRGRYLSIACVSTPNEMVFISDEEYKEVNNLVTLRNFDYDGKTYLHDIQNIILDITKKELEVNL